MADPEAGFAAGPDLLADGPSLRPLRAWIVFLHAAAEIACHLRWALRLVPLAALAGATAAGILAYAIAGNVPAGLTDIPVDRLALQAFDVCAPALAGLVVLPGLVGPLAVRWRDLSAGGAERGLLGVGLSPDVLLRAPSWIGTTSGFAILCLVFHASGHLFGPTLAGLAAGSGAVAPVLPADPGRPALLGAAGGLLVALYVTWGARRETPARPVESLDRAVGLWIASEAALALIGR